MEFSLAVLVAVLCIENAFAGGCPGGYSDGTQMDIGRYWYECRNGQVIPKGCIVDDGRRISLDETFDSQAYGRAKCVRDGDNFMTIIYVGCLHQGTGRDVGSQWDDGTAFYTCVKDGNNPHVITLGCMDQGRSIKLDDRVAKGDWIYQCKGTSQGTPKLEKAGCVYEGRKYNVGESFEGSKFWYTCTDDGPFIMGCMHDGQRLKDGDNFSETADEIMYTCKMSGVNTKYEPFACMQREDNGAQTERRVGCFWIEGSGSYAYEFTCKDVGNGKIGKVQTQCIYRAFGRGTFKVEPGCVRLSPIGAVGCSQDSSGKLTLQVYGADQANSLPDLRRC